MASKSKEKVIPHYLRASTGSCHDICKEVVSGGMKKPEAFMIPSGDETPVKKKVSSSLSSKPKPSPDSLSRSVDALKPKVLTKSYSALTTLKSKVNKLLQRKSKSQSLKAASSSLSRPNQKLRNVKRTDEFNKQLDGYPVEEKTLHVVEMETTSKVVSEHDQNQQSTVEPFPPLSPTESTQKDDECTVSEEAEYYESESTEEEIGMSNGEKKRPDGESPHEEAARKLKFRRGRVVDAETVGEKSARKLKFRKGRGLGEDRAQEPQVRRSFKKKVMMVRKLC
ncbi:unnamed protein product [Microthlaspi erraticum]|uniref:Calmodulin-binding domain-containing protein n=1 Tax=Microthlaspi erraticum TaxID=1685480 RepID=A0A6D2KLS9_9BRAS|nr:unnamed protein product [Microthlaspi erraticum]